MQWYFVSICTWITFLFNPPSILFYIYVLTFEKYIVHFKMNLCPSRVTIKFIVICKWIRAESWHRLKATTNQYISTRALLCRRVLTSQGAWFVHIICCALIGQCFLAEVRTMMRLEWSCWDLQVTMTTNFPLETWVKLLRFTGHNANTLPSRTTKH